MELLGTNVLAWHRYEVIAEHASVHEVLLNALLEIMVESDYILFKPVDAATTVAGRYINGHFEEVPEDEREVRPDLEQALSDVAVFQALPKKMYEFRLNPGRPRRDTKHKKVGT